MVGDCDYFQLIQPNLGWVGAVLSCLLTYFKNKVVLFRIGFKIQIQTSAICSPGFVDFLYPLWLYLELVSCPKAFLSTTHTWKGGGEVEKITLKV